MSRDEEIRAVMEEAVAVEVNYEDATIRIEMPNASKASAAFQIVQTWWHTFQIPGIDPKEFAKAKRRARYEELREEFEGRD